MISKKIIIGISILTAFSACKPAKEKAREQIERAEKILVDNKTKMLKPETASMLVQAYLNYVAKFPEDSLSPNYLYKAAEVSDGLGNPRQAADLYKEVYVRYPNWKKAPVAYFMQAFTLDTRLTDYFHAGQVYESFIIKYPNHKLANDAKFMLDNIGKTDEDLMKALSKRDSAKAIIKK